MRKFVGARELVGDSSWGAATGGFAAGFGASGILSPLLGALAPLGTIGLGIYGSSVASDRATVSLARGAIAGGSVVLAGQILAFVGVLALGGWGISKIKSSIDESNSGKSSSGYMTTSGQNFVAPPKWNDDFGLFVTQSAKYRFNR